MARERLKRKAAARFRTSDALFRNMDIIQRIYQKVFYGMVIGKRRAF